ncbi:Transcription initiation factor IIE subunit beta [Heracleum sosnowskyi]|uniref:Transcription initiation factor IIE subunit beta n=1 Tax=Heracleum sosnowskyi TaxID=360622 RepID=A0AAD8HJN6_9APIA|nr:Transcription initiation factor IIE subunit beta [Heracleum sosnowskyi]
MSAVSHESEDGGWEEVARKPKNRSVGNVGSQNSGAKVSGNPWTGAKGTSNAWPGTKQPVNAWAVKGSASTSSAPAGDYRRAAGRGWNQSSSKEYVNYYDQPAVIPPPLEKGWQWRSNPFQVEKVGNVPALNPADATDDKEEENYDMTQLLKLIQNFPEGIAVADLEDAYPSVDRDLKALKAAGEIWLSNFDSAAEEDMAYPNNHRAIKVDDDLKQLFRGIELPRDMIDIEKDLQKHGMKPATNTAQRRAQAQVQGISNKPEQKKKKKRGISKRTKLTNSIGDLSQKDL